MGRGGAETGVEEGGFVRRRERDGDGVVVMKGKGGEGWEMR